MDKSEDVSSDYERENIALVTAKNELTEIRMQLIRLQYKRKELERIIAQLRAGR